MEDSLKWAALHAYRNAAAAGAVPPIKCPDCTGSELIPQADPDTLLPLLRCLECNSKFKPGSGVWDQIGKNISEAARNLKEENE